MDARSEVEELAHQLKHLCGWPTANVLVSQERVCAVATSTPDLDRARPGVLAGKIRDRLTKAIDSLDGPYQVDGQTVPGTDLREGLRYLLALHPRSTKSAPLNRERAIEAMHLGVSVEKFRGRPEGPELEVMRILAGALSTQPRFVERSAFIQRHAAVHRWFTGREVTKMEVHFAGFSLIDEFAGRLVRVDNDFENVVALYGCEIEDIRQPIEGFPLREYRLKWDALEFVQHHQFGFRMTGPSLERLPMVEERIPIPPADLALSLNFDPDCLPSAVWHFGPISAPLHYPLEPEEDTELTKRKNVYQWDWEANRAQLPGHYGLAWRW